MGALRPELVEIGKTLPAAGSSIARDYAPTLDKLKEVPGMWVKVGVGEGNHVAQQLRRYYPGFEFVTRKTPGGQPTWGGDRDIWAQYVDRKAV